MDVSDEELLRFWQILNANNVHYIMVGGLATMFYGYNRNTDDLDMWLEDNLQNRKNLRAAFIQLSYGDFASIETMQFVPGWTSFYAAGIELDIMTSMKDLKTYLLMNVTELLCLQIWMELEFPFFISIILFKTKKQLTGQKIRLM
ncbi:MAG: hypothetical protein ABJA35_04790 [Parafilimonas sp.]